MINLFSTLLSLADPIGKIIIPTNIPIGIDPATGRLTGIITLMNSLMRVIFIIGGFWAFFNIVLAGFGFISAGGDSKGIAKAWARMWQSLFGLLIIVASFLLAAIVGMIVFKDPTAILNPKLTK